MCGYQTFKLFSFAQTLITPILIFDRFLCSHSIDKLEGDLYKYYLWNFDTVMITHCCWFAFEWGSPEWPVARSGGESVTQKVDSSCAAISDQRSAESEGSATGCNGTLSKTKWCESPETGDRTDGLWMSAEWGLARDYSFITTVRVSARAVGGEGRGRRVLPHCTLVWCLVEYTVQCTG